MMAKHAQKDWGGSEGRGAVVRIAIKGFNQRMYSLRVLEIDTRAETCGILFLDIICQSLVEPCWWSIDQRCCSHGQ